MKKLFRAEIISNKEVKPGIFNMVFKAPEAAAAALPGRFVEVLCARDGELSGPLLRRPFGVHDADAKNGTVEILFKVLGRGTQNLSLKKSGEILDVCGPLGQGFKIREGNVIHIIAGGGMGIAPMLFLAKKLKDPLVFLGAKNADELPVKEKFEKYGKVFLTTDDGSLGDKCFLNVPLEKKLKESKNAVVYACGPRGMLKCLAELGARYKAEVQVSLEEKMACGLGVCRGCPVEVKNHDAKYKMVCKDGPVFNAEEILW